MTPLWHPNLAKLTLWPQEPPVTCWPWQLQREGVPAWQAPEPWALVGHWKPPGWRQHHDQFTCILTGGPPEVEHGMWELQSAVRGYDCAHRGVSLTWGTAGSAMKSAVLQPSAAQRARRAKVLSTHHSITQNQLIYSQPNVTDTCSEIRSCSCAPGTHHNPSELFGVEAPTAWVFWDWTFSFLLAFMTSHTWCMQNKHLPLEWDRTEGTT